MAHIYVIQRFDHYTAKKINKRGEVISRHKDFLAAFKNENSNRLTIAALDTDPEYKVGELAIELLERQEQSIEHRRKVDVAVQILKRTQAGDEIEDGLKFQIADYGFTLADFMESFGQDAQKVIDDEERKRSEQAEKMARLHAIGEEAAQLSAEFCFSFPAVRGIQAGKSFFTTQIPFNMLIKLFLFDEEPVPPELRAQRELNEKRAASIGEYILDNPNTYVLPALTASVSAGMRFVSFGESGATAQIGTLFVPMDAMLLLTDGQHRKFGIETALKERPSLANETVAITLFFDEGLQRSQQMFSDINSTPVKPSAAINALFDHRNGFNVWMKELMKELPVVARRIDKESSSVGAKSIYYWSLISFKKFVSALTGINEKNADVIFSAGNTKEAATEFMKVFFDVCQKEIPCWDSMLKGSVSPADVRQSYVVSHAVFLESLGLACRALVPVQQGTPNFDDIDLSVLAKLSAIDPHKDADMWAGRCIRLGTMQKNTQGVNLTAAKLRDLLGLALSDEMQAVENKLLAEA